MASSSTAVMDVSKIIGLYNVKTILTDNSVQKLRNQKLNKTKSDWLWFHLSRLVSLCRCLLSSSCCSSWHRLIQSSRPRATQRFLFSSVEDTTSQLSEIHLHSCHLEKLSISYMSGVLPTSGTGGHRAISSALGPSHLLAGLTVVVVVVVSHINWPFMNLVLKSCCMILVY